MPDKPTAPLPGPGAGPRAWDRLGHRFETPLLLFRPRWDELVNPRTGAAMERLVLETPEWVNVVARTTAGRFVVVQ